MNIAAKRTVSFFRSSTARPVNPVRFMTKMAKFRTVEHMLYAEEQMDGAGARVRRSIGRSREFTQLDPFLLLDHFDVKPPAGFPEHPHRGFETVTYMLKGSFNHEDFAGHKGSIGVGDLQWMTAGRGILHSEVPGPDGGEGFQLWVNLAKKDKMIEPAYQELRSSDIPVANENGVKAIVIAGECLGVKSPVRTRTPTMYLDITLSPGAVLVQPVNETWNAFSYVISGKVAFGPPDEQQEKETFYCVIYAKDGANVRMENTTAEDARLVLIAGQPLNEPLARRGPMVMNTQEEIDQAFRDFRNSQNGFERGKNWTSRFFKGD
ncbi:uncharacterized protein LOC129588677 [Paramacrobiotus metropolitanus]|uniref:uncharacterized protein LOC129588677 n=1 Tax=Paramacrobiotus metropolitanus TaxID=2943436 RepID=UPI002445A768|nr:uncharacterized protein LOC129588677 [Paramacrobiotus metropolitanus]